MDDAIRRGLLFGKVHTAEVRDHSPAGFIVDVEVADADAAFSSTSSSTTTASSSASSSDDTDEAESDGAAAASSHGNARLSLFSRSMRGGLVVC
jgi:hypothetical protein